MKQLFPQNTPQTFSAQEPVCISVLGGGGFLGSHLVERLIADTVWHVRVVDTDFSKLSVDSERLTRIQKPLQSPGLVEELVGWSDVLVSMTALCNPALYNTRPVEVIHESFTHLIPLVQLCADKNKWLVHLSTCEVYGKPEPSPDRHQRSHMSEDTSLLIFGPVEKERWSYACAKQLMERLIWAQGKHAGLDFTIVRPFNVIGPRMDFIPGVDGEGVPRVLACFMHALLFGEPLKLVADGLQRRSFIYVDDFIDGLMGVLLHPKASQGEIVNLGNADNEVSMLELAERMVSVFREQVGPVADPATLWVPAVEFYGSGYDDSNFRVPDMDKARRLFGFNPRWDLDTMLEVIVEDYVQRYGKRKEPG